VKDGEDFEGWRERVRSDITWGMQTLSDHLMDYEPLAFAPPYDNYGQDGSNDPRVAGDLLGWLTPRALRPSSRRTGTRARNLAISRRSAASRSTAEWPAAISTTCSSPGEQ
jgi:hypothetical protein